MAIVQQTSTPMQPSLGALRENRDEARSELVQLGRVMDTSVPNAVYERCYRDLCALIDEYDAELARRGAR